MSQELTPQQQSGPEAARIPPRAAHGDPKAAIAWAAVIGIWFTVSVRLVLQMYTSSIFAAIAAGNTEYRSVDFWIPVLGGIQILAFLIAGSLFLAWLHRARRDAGRISPDRLRFGRGWTIGVWFVPVANLLLGPLTVADVWRASAPIPAKRAFPVLGWAGCVLMGIAMNYSAVIGRTALGDARDRAAVFTLFHGIESVFVVAAAALITVILRRVSRWQADALGGAAGPV